jgi:hypothetical protein
VKSYGCERATRARPHTQPGLAGGGAVTRLVERFCISLACASGLALMSCGHASEPTAQLPRFVNVEMRQALLGPSKVGGNAWDGLGRLDDNGRSLVVTALGKADPVAELAVVFANPALAALEKPDPGGSVRCMSGPVELQRLELPKVQDTFTPIWSGAVLPRVPLAPATRLEVDLWDQDLAVDDPMGTSTITYAELVSALREGTVHHVRVAEQTNHQVLFVDVSVTGAR